ALYSGAERVRLRAEPARVEDTTGAGDALCAGFLAAWLSGVPADVALRRGVEVAARAVESLGARPGD
ncbi:MAG TPA: PfkB family carbohydrate kinase, partial [Rubrobacteraceae bacterium]|nr:PfkB family carbohydrate kinase [Rubrobacteraceae bacterium]